MQLPTGLLPSGTPLDLPSITLYLIPIIYFNQPNSGFLPREIALTLILTRAGLELSPKQLKKLKGVVPLLAFGPCVVEALTCALLFFLFFQELEPSIWFCLVAG